MAGEKKTKKSGGFSSFAIIVVLVAVGLPLFKTFQAEDPISYMLPNLLLFTGYREWTKELWLKVLKFDKNINYPPAHIPEIDAKDYNFESLKRATENFRYPAVVRGLFNNTPAQLKWPTLDYLPSRIGHYNIPVVNDAKYGKMQNNRSVRAFGEVFPEIVSDPNNRAYLFFPVQSRFNFNGSDPTTAKALAKELNDIIREDLDLDRLWKGFGTPAHKTYFGSQIIIGQGSEDSEQTTGTGWHCAAGNNWFAQVSFAHFIFFLSSNFNAQTFCCVGCWC